MNGVVTDWFKWTALEEPLHGSYQFVPSLPDTNAVITDHWGLKDMGWLRS